MITRTDLPSNLRPPLLHLPFQALGTNDRWPQQRYNTHVLCRHPLALHQRTQPMNPIPPLPQHKRQALLRKQIDLPIQQLAIISRLEQVMHRREGLIHAPTERAQRQHISPLIYRPALMLLPQPPERFRKVGRLLFGLVNYVRLARTGEEIAYMAVQRVEVSDYGVGELGMVLRRGGNKISNSG